MPRQKVLRLEHWVGKGRKDGDKLLKPVQPPRRRLLGVQREDGRLVGPDLGLRQGPQSPCAPEGGPPRTTRPAPAGMITPARTDAANRAPAHSRAPPGGATATSPVTPVLAAAATAAVVPARPATRRAGRPRGRPTTQAASRPAMPHPRRRRRPDPTRPERPTPHPATAPPTRGETTAGGGSPEREPPHPATASPARMPAAADGRPSHRTSAAR